MIRALLGALLLAHPAAARTLVLEAEVVWRDPAPAHGGVSGIEVSADGSEALTIGDRGAFARVALEREGGRLTGVRTLSRDALRDTEGRVAAGYRADAEGLAVRPDGRIYVSLEGQARVWTWRDTGTEAAWMTRAPGFRQLARNAALEALAIDARGRLWTLPETEGGPLWVHDGDWRVAAMREGADGFAAVGADFGPDGALWLLERKLAALGFRSRIRRLVLDGTRLVSDEIVHTTRTGAHGNLEGLSVWEDAAGTVRLTAVEDENFLPLIETRVVEWRLEP